MKWMTALLGMVFISLTAHASTEISTPPTLTEMERPYPKTSEGFTFEVHQSNLQSAWDQTYVISDVQAGNPAISASVLIFKRRLGDDLYLGFLTSGHSLRRTVSRVEADLGKIQISRNIRIQQSFSLEETLSGSMLSPVMDMEKDLGFFILKLPGTKASDFEVVPISPDCRMGFGDSIELIGFPGVVYRALKDQRVKISDPDLITKRASAGIYIGEMKFGKDQSGDRYPIFGTTADAMDGNSGGPALNSRGHVVGILIGSEANKENGYVYKGSENPRALKAHSFITDCQVTKTFAFEIWSKFFQEIQK